MIKSVAYFLYVWATSIANISKWQQQKIFIGFCFLKQSTLHAFFHTMESEAETPLSLPDFVRTFTDLLYSIVFLWIVQEK